jgi:hypothetical protein
MDEKPGEGSDSDTRAKAEDTVKGLAEQAGTTVQQARDRGQAVGDDLQARAGEAAEQAATLTRKVSAAGAQAAGAVQDAGREAGNQIREGAAALYQQGARAGGYVGQYAAEQPLTALLIAGAVGYGLAYLIHRR